MSILHGCRNLKFTSTILSMFGFPSIWWRFWSRWSFWRTSIIRILLRLICFPSDLHVKGLRYWWISSKIQFCLVWYPWWLRHGAMEPLEATPLWVTVDELDVGIDTFELVIRLSKVEQTALPFISLMSCPAIPAVLCEPLGWSSLCWMSIWTVRNFRFTAAAPAFKVQHDMNARTWMPGHECQAGTWPSGVVFFVFDGFWWGWTFRAFNSLEEQLFMPLRTTWLRSRRGVRPDTCCSWNWVLFRLIVLVVSRPSPTSPHSVPNSSIVILRNVSWV